MDNVHHQVLWSFCCTYVRYFERGADMKLFRLLCEIPANSYDNLCQEMLDQQVNFLVWVASS